MKWYTVSWTDLVTVECPRLFDNVPWWLRRPSRYVSEWQRRSVRIEAENVREAVVRTANPLRAELILEEDTIPKSVKAAHLYLVRCPECNKPMRRIAGDREMLLTCCGHTYREPTVPLEEVLRS